jgi:hypothetical protein
MCFAAFRWEKADEDLYPVVPGKKPVELPAADDTAAALAAAGGGASVPPSTTVNENGHAAAAKEPGSA